MRKALCLIMGVLFLITIITGFAESHVHPGDAGLHTVVAVLFIASILVHAVINRKALARYLMANPAKNA
jgi:hypothetical protein